MSRLLSCDNIEEQFRARFNDCTNNSQEVRFYVPQKQFDFEDLIVIALFIVEGWNVCSVKIQSEETYKEYEKNMNFFSEIYEEFIESLISVSETKGFNLKEFLDLVGSSKVPEMLLNEDVIDQSKWALLHYVSKTEAESPLEIQELMATCETVFELLEKPYVIEKFQQTEARKPKNLAYVNEYGRPNPNQRKPQRSLFRRPLKHKQTAKLHVSHLSQLAVAPAPSTVFDDARFTNEVIKKACDEAANQLFHTALDVTSTNDMEKAELLVSVGRDTFDSTGLNFEIGEEIGKGASGSVFGLKGDLSNDLSNTVLKVIKYDDDEESGKGRRSHNEWLVAILSEAALLRVFSESGTGPAVPRISATMSRDRKVAYLLMERADGDVGRLCKSLEARRIFDKYKPDIENQIRNRVTEALRAGVVCVDFNVGNILYKRLEQDADDAFSIILSDFDTFYCCSLANSRAREALSKYNVILPVSVTGFTENTKVQTVDILPEQLFGEMCPEQTEEAIEDTVTLSLGLIGMQIGVFEEEKKIAKEFLENKENKNHPLYMIFRGRWKNYNKSLR